MNLLLVSGSAVVRGQLGALLSRLPGVERVETARDFDEGLRLSVEVSIDIAVVDFQPPLPVCLAAIARLRAQRPQMRVIALAAHTDARYFEACLSSGACAYVLKDAAWEELRDALAAASRSERRFISPRALAEASASRRKTPDADPGV